MTKVVVRAADGGGDDAQASAFGLGGLQPESFAGDRPGELLKASAQPRALRRGLDPDGLPLVIRRGLCPQLGERDGRGCGVGGADRRQRAEQQCGKEQGMAEEQVEVHILWGAVRKPKPQERVAQGAEIAKAAAPLSSEG